MNKAKLARELTSVARTLVAGTGQREFQEQIDAISRIQEFIEDEAMTWDALSGKMVQSALRRASKHLASARNEMYNAWDLRDKFKPV